MEQQTDFGYQLGFGRANVWLMQEKVESILSSSEIVGCLEAVVWRAHTHTHTHKSPHKSMLMRLDNVLQGHPSVCQPLNILEDF
jgi:hypothetical protein